MKTIKGYLLLLAVLVLVSGLSAGCAQSKESSIIDFWREVQKYREVKMSEQLESDRKFLSGNIIAQTWLYEKERNITAIADFPFTLRIMKKEYENVPISKEEISSYTQKSGDYPLHPKDLLINLYLSIKPQPAQYNYYKESAWLTDWRMFFLSRKAAFPDALGQPYKAEFMAELSRYETSLGQLFQEIGDKHILAYSAVPPIMLTGHSQEEQDLIKRYFSAGSQLEKQQLQGNRAITSFNKELETASIRLRLLSPELDAWLFFWGFNDTILTNEGKQKYLEICNKYRKSP